MRDRTGKIARLPLDLRNELNRRLERGEQGKALVEWLNDQPETEVVLAAYFDGRMINEQNLSDWKAGGYQDWLAERALQAEARSLSENAGMLAKAGGALPEHLVTVLAIRYAAVLAEWNGVATDEFERNLRSLDRLRQSVVALQRGHHRAIEVELKQRRYEDGWKKAERERRCEENTNEAIKEMMIHAEKKWNKENPDKQRHYSFLKSDEWDDGSEGEDEEGGLTMEDGGGQKLEVEALENLGIKELKSSKGGEVGQEEPRTLNVERKPEMGRGREGAEQKAASSRQSTGGKSTSIKANQGQSSLAKGGSVEAVKGNIQQPADGGVAVAGRENREKEKGNFQPRMDTDAHGWKTGVGQGENIPQPEEVEAKPGISNIEPLNPERKTRARGAREAGRQSVAEAKAENEGTAQQLIEEIKSAKTAAEGNAPQMPDLEARALEEKKKVRVDAIVWPYRVSRRYRQ